MKFTGWARIDALDDIHRFDPRSPNARPGEGYGISIVGAGGQIWITIGDREVDVPVVADRLIELLDQMRWQAMRRIAATSNDEEAVTNESIGNSNTREVPTVPRCVCGHTTHVHDHASRGGCTFCECARYVRFTAANNAPA